MQINLMIKMVKVQKQTEAAVNDEFNLLQNHSQL